MDSRILFLCLPLFLIACQPKFDVIELHGLNDLIPEGIAVDPETGTIYLSSLYQDKIVSYAPEDYLGKDLIASRAQGFKHGLGMEVRDNLLFALSYENLGDRYASMLLVYDLAQQKIINTYQHPDTLSIGMNDLAVSPDYTVYMTDSGNGRVFQLAYPFGSLEVFMADTQFYFPNGIAISGDGQTLYVDSYSQGLRIIDIPSKTILNAKSDETAGIGIDGVKFAHGDLYAIVNGGNDKSKHGLFQIELSDNQREIVRVKPLIQGHEKMNIPTTLSVAGDHVYVLANSQLESLDQQQHRLIDPGTLTPTYVIQYPIQR